MVARELVATSGPKQNPCGSRKIVELIQHDAGPDADRARFQIQIGDLTIVAREIDDQTLADRSAGKAAAGAARRDGKAGVGRGEDRFAPAGALRGNATAAGSI